MTHSISIGTEPQPGDAAVPPPHRQASVDGTARRRWKLIAGRVGVLVVVLLLWQLVAGRLVDTSISRSQREWSPSCGPGRRTAASSATSLPRWFPPRKAS